MRLKSVLCSTYVSAVKDTDDPAAMETVSVLAPLPPPTLHLRSLEAKSRSFSTEVRRTPALPHTSHRRVIVGVLSNVKVHRVSFPIGAELLKDVYCHVSQFLHGDISDGLQ